MQQLFTVAKREMKLGFRNSWTYSFLFLLSIFTVSLLVLQSGITSIREYTDTTATILNLTIYLLPLISLLLGSFSISGDKENGQWGLLSTYPLSPYSFIWGKWLGLSLVILTMLLFSFGLAGVISILFKQTLSLDALIFFWLFSSVLAILYVSISVWIGALAKNRWQALIGGIAVWFMTIMMWPLLMISTLSHLPSYSMIQPALQIFTLFNPAELVRIFSIMQLGAGSVFGASYDPWVTWATSGWGWIFFAGAVLTWVLASVFIGGFLWNRGDHRGAA